MDASGKSNANDEKTEETPPKLSSGQLAPNEVLLLVEDDRFTVDKNLLMEKCDYFKAMFGGSYKESLQQEIVIQMITPRAMRYILNFFEKNTIDISDLDSVGDILHATNYLHLNSLNQLVINKLLSLIKSDTCFQILNIAKTYDLSNIESKVKSYVLYSFDDVRAYVKSIKDISTLFWYLSHEHLNVTNEYDVFQAGLDWLVQHGGRKDDILVILSCLLYKNIDRSHMEEILSNSFVRNHEVALNVIKAILELCNIQPDYNFSDSRELERVLKNCDSETLDIVHNFLSVKKSRTAALISCNLKKSGGRFEIMAFNSEDNKLVSHLSIPGPSWWGHSVVSWKGFTIIVLCGKIKEKDTWNLEMLVYNFLDQKWNSLPSYTPMLKRHATVVVNDDIIYVIGGFGQYRIVLQTVQTYNLKTNQWSQLPNIPECSSCIMATFHKGKLFVAGDYLYVYKNNYWQNLWRLSSRCSAMISYNDRLYFTERWKNRLLYWDIDDTPHHDSNARLVKRCHYNAIGICNIDNTAFIFSEGDDLEYSISVESCSFDCNEDYEGVQKTDLLWLDKEPDGKFYNISGCFTLAKLDVKDSFISTYGERWLT